MKKVIAILLIPILSFSLVLIPTTTDVSHVDAAGNSSTAFSTAVTTVQKAPVKTSAQLKAYAAKLNKKGILVDNSVYSMNPQLMYLSLQQIYNLSNKVPVLKQFFSKGNKLHLYATTTDSSGKNWLNTSTQAQANYRVVGGKAKVSIYFNPTVYNYTRYNYRTLNNLLKTAYNDSYVTRSAKLGKTTIRSTFHAKVPTQNLPIYAVTHEIGHITDYISYYNGNRSIQSSSIYGMTDSQRFYGATTATLVNRLSLYSSYNVHEAFAELFASYYLGGSSTVRGFGGTIVGRQQLTPYHYY
jgi:hypothetical protein